MKRTNTTTKNVATPEKRGASVKVRLCGGEIVDRIVWEKVGEVVYICSPRSYQWLLNEEPDRPQPVGFPEDAIMEWCGKT